MPDNGPQNCWEYWNCPKEISEHCLVYKEKAGRRCWEVSGNFCPKLKNDWDCRWYNRLNAATTNFS